MTLSEFKIQVINHVKNYYTGNVILPTYPLFKQSNLIRAGGQPLTDMGTFIDGKIVDIDEIETAINALSDQAILTNFTEVNDADDSAYVVSVLTGLTDADQKISVACALRWLKMRG